MQFSNEQKKRKSTSKQQLSINDLDNASSQKTNQLIKSQQTQQVVSLLQLFNDNSKKPFIQAKQITFNYCQIENLSQPLPRQIAQQIEKLYLSHNLMSNLSGIQQFSNLKQLSVAYNKIADLNEFAKIDKKETLLLLKVQSNPFTAHPNYQQYLLDMFPNLQRLDDLKVSNKKDVEKCAQQVNRNLMSFLYYLDEDMVKMETFLSKQRIKLEISRQATDDTILITQTTQNWNNKHFDLKRAERLSMLNDNCQINGNNNEQHNHNSLLTSLAGVVDFYGPYEGRQISNARSQFYHNYKRLFQQILKQYRSNFDRTLETFLVDRVIANPDVSLERFQNDPVYAEECVLYEFYKLHPVQADINGVVCFDVQNTLLDTEFPTSTKFVNENKYDLCLDGQSPLQNHTRTNKSSLFPNTLAFQIEQFNDQKNLWKFKHDECTSNLELPESSPDQLKNQFLVHFPVFPYNRNYIQALNSAVFMKIGQLVKIYQDILDLKNESVHQKQIIQDQAKKQDITIKEEPLKTKCNIANKKAKYYQQFVPNHFDKSQPQNSMYIQQNYSINDQQGNKNRRNLSGSQKGKKSHHTTNNSVSFLNQSHKQCNKNSIVQAPRNNNFHANKLKLCQVISNILNKQLNTQKIKSFYKILQKNYQRKNKKYHQLVKQKLPTFLSVISNKLDKQEFEQKRIGFSTLKKGFSLIKDKQKQQRQLIMKQYFQQLLDVRNVRKQKEQQKIDISNQNKKYKVIYALMQYKYDKKRAVHNLIKILNKNYKRAMHDCFQKWRIKVLSLKEIDTLKKLKHYQQNTISSRQQSFDKQNTILLQDKNKNANKQNAINKHQQRNSLSRNSHYCRSCSKNRECDESKSADDNKENQQTCLNTKNQSVQKIYKINEKRINYNQRYSRKSLYQIQKSINENNKKHKCLFRKCAACRQFKNL